MPTYETYIQGMEPHDNIIIYYVNTVSSYDGVASLCRCSSVSEVRKVFVYVNGAFSFMSSSNLLLLRYQILLTCKKCKRYLKA